LREVEAVAPAPSAAALSAVLRALAGETAAVVVGTDIRALLALFTPLRAPLPATWVTRSPPRTGRPA
jgi:hypothetical protein